ncbi:hypothetical protein LR948_05915 [Roseivivax sp. GX 12232]|uniref:hypothetical protein n=1 Tax=Roseivivax sp. GX 12232 TaxID=2900547 RepID=UPI001E62C93F|nr:hypothetical protein [Roseivivax sp. GX 12232]MCE0504879.1 hypothetical protein [Roseivivax sp. GX 12232]
MTEMGWPHLLAFTLTLPAAMAAPVPARIPLNHLAVDLVVRAVLAALWATPAARAGHLRLKPARDRATGAVPGAPGLRLLFDR